MKSMHNLVCSVCERNFKSKYPIARNCEACKQFFRRVVSNCKLYECKWAGKCPSGRCSGCRLDKCLLVGLNPRAVPPLPLLEEGSRLYLEELDRRKAELAQRMETAVAMRHPVVVVDHKMTETGRCLSEVKRIEEKMDLFFEHKTVFREGFLEQFASLKELINFGSEILCKFDNYMTKYADNRWGPEQSSTEEKFNRPFFGFDNPDIRPLVSVVAMSQMLPNLPLLSIEDKVCLLSYVGLPVLDCISRFHPTRKNLPMSLYPCGFRPRDYFRRHQLYRGDQIVQNLAEGIYIRALDVFDRVKMSTEEFLLLRAILFSHSAAPGLSSHGQTVLRKESERLARILMHFSQSRRGELEGARRYAELMCLAENVFHCARRRREFSTYVIVVTDREAYEREFPKGLKPMVNAEMR